MNTELLRQLPLGTSSFQKLRQLGQIYVDKTDKVYTLACQNGKYFLARPRRFGKSLLISTFESLFKYGMRDFHGLKIEKLWKEEEKLLVIRLDFSEAKSFRNLKEFELQFHDLIVEAFAPYGFRFELHGTSLISQLSTWFKKQALSSVVLLIDEYDAPLTSCLDRKDLFEDVRTELSRFYATLKSNDAALRFLFITGITKFNKTSIFSELNNLSDISLSAEYGSLLGYTHTEVQEYFSEYLISASETLGTTKEELLLELTEHYDGFCFEETAKQKVFAPWSLLRFFSSPERGLKDYWFESGGKPSVLIQYLQSHSLKNPKEYDKEQSLPLNVLSSSSDVENLSDVGLLTQAGYLTIKSVEYGDTVFLGYPNKEVKRAIAQLYLEQLLNGRVPGQVGAGPIVKVLSKDKPEAVFHILNRLFAAIDYARYPVRDESSLRAFVQVYFSGAGLNSRVEHHNAHGRADLEVEIGERTWIFEFKVSREGESAESKLQEELTQIQARRYGADSASKVLYRMALVFGLKERAFIKWGCC